MKNNKKGFSLVELIAIILILGILILVAVPAYNAIMNRYKRKIYEEKIALIKIASEKYAQDKRLSESASFTVDFLIQVGYLTPDKTSEGAKKYDMINPINDKSMLCYLANVKIKNASYNATVQEDYNCKEEEKKDYNDIVQYVFECDATGCNIGNVENLAKPIQDILAESSILTNDTFNGRKMTKWSNKDLLVVLSSPNDVIYGGNVTKYYANGFLSLGKRDNLAQRINDCYTGKTYCANTYVISCESGNLCTYPLEIELKGTNVSRYDAIYARIDKNKPTITVTSPEAWSNQAKNITVIASDDNYGIAGSGVTKATIGGTTLAIEDDRVVFPNYMEGTYTVKVTDNAGNTATQNVEVVNIDTTPPTCDSVTWAPDEKGIVRNWVKDKRTLIGGCADEEGGSGCVVDGVNFVYTWPPNSSAKVLRKIPPSKGVNAGQAEVEYTIYDRAGNMSVCRVDDGTVSVNLEKIPPVIRRVEKGVNTTTYSVRCTGNGIDGTKKSCTATFDDTYPSSFRSINLKIEAKDTNSGISTSNYGSVSIGRYTYITRIGYSKVTRTKERTYGFIGKYVDCWKYPTTTVSVYDVAGNYATITLKSKFSGYRECKYV